MTTNNPFPQPICEQIWNDKYRLTTPNESILDDLSVEDTWKRIANACADAEITTYLEKTIHDPEMVAQERRYQFNEALRDFKFIPAGRIVAGAGSGRNVTLFNCYVMGTIPDDMGGIFEMLREAALTMQQGGGIGYDFTPLRPKNSPVKGVDADASGPLSFMDVWDAMCRTIMSAGSRRGAMMATMRCDHPDVLDFVTAKQDAARLRMFNVSVLATDAFMHAVKNDAMWPLVHDVAPADTSLGQDAQGKWIYEWVQAKDLWDSIMQSTYDFAEPGVIFIDRINKMNNLWYIEQISATNPCGEQPLPPYGACLLGSINLAKMVTDPFETSAQVDRELLRTTVRTAVKMLDAVIDISKFPIPQQEREAKAKRRMGLGVTGLHDMLWMLGFEYGSDSAVEYTEILMQDIAIAAYEESIELARLFGPCPVTATEDQRELFIQSGNMRNMPYCIRDGVLEHGIRNALLTSIAPTGTISLYAGNISSGVEPIFAPEYTRKVLEKDGSKREEVVRDYAVQIYHEWRESKGMDKEPEVSSLKTAQDLSPMAHLKMQAAVQKWVDSSISKTVNLPEDISFEDFGDVYMQAYDMGCKGCTTYRPNAVTGSVLSVEPKKEATPVAENTTDDTPTREEWLDKKLYMAPPIEVPAGPIPRVKILGGQTYKLKWEGNNFYVTINNHLGLDGIPIPFEIFINTQDMSKFQYVLALTRMMSSVFRRGGDISFVIEDLKSIMDPNGGDWVGGKYIPSFMALLGLTLEEHLALLKMDAEFESVFAEGGLADEAVTEAVQETKAKPMQCTSCKGFNVHVLSGCPTCGDCGHSKCG